MDNFLIINDFLSMLVGIHQILTPLSRYGAWKQKVLGALRDGGKWFANLEANPTGFGE